MQEKDITKYYCIRCKHKLWLVLQTNEGLCYSCKRRFKIEEINKYIENEDIALIIMPIG